MDISQSLTCIRSQNIAWYWLRKVIGTQHCTMFDTKPSTLVTPQRTILLILERIHQSAT